MRKRLESGNYKVLVPGAAMSTELLGLVAVASRFQGAYIVKAADFVNDDIHTDLYWQWRQDMGGKHFDIRSLVTEPAPDGPPVDLSDYVPYWLALENANGADEVIKTVASMATGLSVDCKINLTHEG